MELQYFTFNTQILLGGRVECFATMARAEKGEKIYAFDFCSVRILIIVRFFKTKSFPLSAISGDDVLEAVLDTATKNYSPYITERLWRYSKLSRNDFCKSIATKRVSNIVRQLQMTRCVDIFRWETMHI